MGKTNSNTEKFYSPEIVSSTIKNIDHLENITKNVSEDNILINSDIITMWEVVQVWKYEGKFPGYVDKFEKAYIELDVKRRSEIELGLEESKIELKKILNEFSIDFNKGNDDTETKQVESKKSPLSPEKIRIQTNVLKNIIKNNYISVNDIAKINQKEISKIFIQYYISSGDKTKELLKSFSDLENTILEFSKIYIYQLNNDSDFKEAVEKNKKYDLIPFLKEILCQRYNIIFEELSVFAKKIEQESFDSLLHTYKELEKSKPEDYSRKKVLVKEIIFKKYILDKGGEVLFIGEGKTGITGIESHIVNNITETFSEEDMKGFALRNIIKREDIDYENINYSILITQLLKDSGIKILGSDVVYNDLFDNEKKDIIFYEIRQKIKSGDVFAKEKSELYFIINYIDNKNNYTNKLLEDVSSIMILEKQGLDISSSSWLNKLGNSFKKGKSISHLFGEIASAGEGSLGIGIALFTVLGLFSSKYRKYSLGLLAAVFVLPGMEDIAHNFYGDYINSEKGDIDIEKKSKFNLDINIVGLSEKYKKKYKGMQEENFYMEDGFTNKMDSGDLAQCFSQLSNNELLLDKSIIELQRDMETKQAGEILGISFPISYKDNLLLSSNNKPVNRNRVIDEKMAMNFLRLLIKTPELGDKTVADLFVKGVDKSSEYILDEKYLNELIAYTLKQLPLGDSLRGEIEELVKPSPNIHTIASIPTKIFHMTTSEDKEQEFIRIIEGLESLKTKYPDKNILIDELLNGFKESLSKMRKKEQNKTPEKNVSMNNEGETSSSENVDEDLKKTLIPKLNLDNIHDDGKINQFLLDINLIKEKIELIKDEEVKLSIMVLLEEKINILEQKFINGLDGSTENIIKIRENYKNILNSLNKQLPLEFEKRYFRIRLEKMKIDINLKIEEGENKTINDMINIRLKDLLIKNKGLTGWLEEKPKRSVLELFVFLNANRNIGGITELIDMTVINIVELLEKHENMEGLSKNLGYVILNSK